MRCVADSEMIQDYTTDIIGVLWMQWMLNLRECFLPLALGVLTALSLGESLAVEYPVPDAEGREIEKLLTTQAACWNREDIDGFMQTYWKSDQLTFSSGGKTVKGWQATLDRYKKSYPSGSMGKLNFDGLEIDLLSSEVALVLGNWHLDIKGVKKGGNFSLVLKKIGGHWKIVHDHSSSLEPND